MLSPHEFATLMLVKEAPDQVDLNRADLDALLEQQLVSLEQLTRGCEHLDLTAEGHSVLKALTRNH